MLEAGQVSSKVPQKKSNQIKSNVWGEKGRKGGKKKKSLNKKNPPKKPKQKAKKLEANDN